MLGMRFSPLLRMAESINRGEAGSHHGRRRCPRRAWWMEKEDIYSYTPMQMFSFRGREEAYYFVFSKTREAWSKTSINPRPVPVTWSHSAKEMCQLKPIQITSRWNTKCSSAILILEGCCREWLLCSLYNLSAHPQSISQMQSGCSMRAWSFGIFLWDYFALLPTVVLR